MKWATSGPGAPLAATGYIAQPVGVEVQGRFTSVSAFLGELRRLQLAEQLGVRPDECQLLVTRSTEHRALHRCLEQLTPGQRQLATLAYGDGLSPQQIAERKAQTANVVHVMLSKLRRILRECVLRKLGAAG